MKRRLLPFVLALGILAADRAAKYAILSHFGPMDIQVVIPGFFNIIHTENTGMAFSLLTDSRLLLIGISAPVMLLLAWMLWSSPSLPLGLIFGGAAGNLYDRIVRGSVTDFLDFYIANQHWPTFNIADSAITAGAALLLVALWREHKR